MVTSPFTTPSILSLNGTIIKQLCFIIGKMNISYVYQVKPAYQTSVSPNPICQVWLVTILCHLSQLSNLDTIIGDLRQNKIYLSKSDKIGQDIKFFNESIMDKFVNTNEQLDIDSWFDQDAEYSMIFIFVSCIIALLAFTVLVFLCFKHEKLRKLISLYMASPQVVNAAALDSTCNTGNIFQYLLSTICILILIYAINKMIICGSQYIHRYQTTTYFLCEHGYDKGPSMAIALELSTMS